MSVEPVYVLVNGDLTIDAPASEVWPHVLNYPSWQNYSSVQHVSGEPGAEGEVVLLRKDEKGFAFPPYYARTIRLEVARRAIWKTYPERTRPDNDFFGIVEFRLQDRGAQTRFSYDTLYEFMVAYNHKSELDTFRSQQQRNFEILVAAIFPKLKDLAERRGARAR